MKQFLIVSLLFFSSFYCLKAQEKTDDLLNDKQENKWCFELTPYFWAASIHNNMTIGHVSLKRDHKFKDIFDNLKYAIPIHFEFGKNRWTIITDFFYSKDEVTQTAQYTFFQKLPSISTVDFITDYTVTKMQCEVLGDYLVTHKRSKSKVSVILGVRYTNQKNDLELVSESILDTLDYFPLSYNVEYFDPLIGLRYKIQFFKNWKFYFRKDIGGFSVGSKFTCNLMAQIAYQAARFMDIELGYRWLYVNYDNNKTGIDQYNNKSHEMGAVISLKFRW